MVLNGKKIGIFNIFVFFDFLKCVFWVQEGLENDPEPRGDVLTKFGPKRSHLDPIRVHFYGFGVPLLRTCLPMSAWGCEKKMICWSDDMIWRYDDMIRRSEDMIIWWSEDMTILSGLLFMAAITLLFFSFCRPAVRHLISIQHLTPNEFQMRGECLVWRSRCMCSTRLLPKYKYPWVASIGPSTCLK